MTMIFRIACAVLMNWKHESTVHSGAFQSSRVDPEHAWMGGALRTGLSTQLSELSGAKVYSQAFVDFLMTHEKLSEIEVAHRLGIETMLTGSVLVEGDAVRVEAQIIDVVTGLLERMRPGRYSWSYSATVARYSLPTFAPSQSPAAKIAVLGVWFGKNNPPL